MLDRALKILGEACPKVGMRDEISCTDQSNLRLATWYTMKSRLLAPSVFLLAMALVFTSSWAQAPTKCGGTAPDITGVTFTCKDNAWHSSGDVLLTSCTVTRVNSPVVINGALTMEPRSMIVYEPQTLNPKPLITITACAHFNQSAMLVNLSSSISQEMVYATSEKQENGWIYLLPIEANCSSMNVSMLAFEPEIHWSYGIAINSTLITNKKTSITFATLEAGHSAIQLGFQSGSPVGSLSWFPAMIGIFGSLLLIIVGSEWVKYCLQKPAPGSTPKPAHSNGSINHDDSRAVLLEDTD